MSFRYAVGIDLGTTYSSIAYLNAHGEPVTVPNQEGEPKTPSVVWFDGDEVVVGTEALRNAISEPGRVVQNAKRFMGLSHRWVVDGRSYSPEDISAFILRKLLRAAEQVLGPVEHAVVTVPAQFSDVQREATARAAMQAGLKDVTIINEPVAAALCYVLGTEGLWFTELASDQRVLVFDLGGGTFDLSLIEYGRQRIAVVASTGDLHLGGVDWNNALLDYVAELFRSEFGSDPRDDAQSLQFLAMEVENAKRSLSVRRRAAVTCQHAGHRKTYQVERERFEELTRPLVERTTEITEALLKGYGLGWAHVDVVLPTGGASRMPMIRENLQRLSGRTLNVTLSPDQSIAHGAAYYAGLLRSHAGVAGSVLSTEVARRLKRLRPRAVSTRALGILIRDKRTNRRVPHYLIPAGTPLPASVTKAFGTVKPNQRRVRLQVVESGTRPGEPYVKLGTCLIERLPPNLPEGAIVDVTLEYDEQARVQVSAREAVSGRLARAVLVRPESVRPLPSEPGAGEESQEAGPTGRQPKASEAEGVEASAAPSRPASVRSEAGFGAEVEAGRRETGARAGEPTVLDQSQRLAEPVEPAGLGTDDGQRSPARTSKRPDDVDEELDVVFGLSRQEDELDEADQPVPLCNRCAEPLDALGRCPRCGRR